ncbi:MAG: DNA-binding transcriptional regulator [Pirellulales bacterium]
MVNLATRPTHVGLAFVHSFAYYRRILRGIWRYVEARPHWQLTSIAPEQQPARLRGRFRPDGLIVALNTIALERALATWRRPAVNVSAVFSRQRFARVGVDNVQVGRLAANHFLERGLRHFAFVGPPRHLFSTQRREAFCQALQEAGHAAACYDDAAKLEFDPLGHLWDLGPDVLRWLRKLPTPVGVFTPNDLWGVQVVLACRRADLRVPEDVAVLGVDDDDLYCELTRPRLSSIIVPAEQIGYEAVALLERLLAGEKPPCEPVLLPPAGINARRSSEVLAIEDEDVVAAVRFIREHAHRPVRVADVLEHVPLGRRTLERRCRAALGWGVAEEIRRTHVERACRLLAGTNLSMRAVASHAGFLDYRHLAVVFRKQLRTTPTAYRRQMRSPIGAEDTSG